MTQARIISVSETIRHWSSQANATIPAYWVAVVTFHATPHGLLEHVKFLGETAKEACKRAKEEFPNITIPKHYV